MKDYKEFRKDLIIHGVIYTTSLIIFTLITWLLAAFKYAPVLILALSLNVASWTFFGLYVLWFRLKWRRVDERGGE